MGNSRSDDVHSDINVSSEEYQGEIRCGVQCGSKEQRCERPGCYR